MRTINFILNEYENCLFVVFHHTNLYIVLIIMENIYIELKYRAQGHIGIISRIGIFVYIYFVIALAYTFIRLKQCTRFIYTNIDICVNISASINV